jgi:2-polyprenyl-6-methoxyphenol hydroxylase-like FAD-dependent oxidoreductase
MKNILIVGAGPVGLTAAIELTRLGMAVRIIDKNSERSQFSKALAINPRTLELLEPAGISPQLISAGRKLQQLHIRDTQGELVTLRLDRLKHRYNFMLTLPQSETEAILEENLQRLGVSVERNTELQSFTQNEQNVIAQIMQQNILSDYRSDYLIGADGARSKVRHQAGLQFVGITFPEEWQLADIRLANPFPPEAQVYLLADRVSVFLPFKPELVRIISNTKHDIFDTPLLKTGSIKEIVWQSHFKIDYCQASSYQKDRIFLAGDAAHIHSPVGGRGMNLGIEDAVVLAQLMASNKLENYTTLRFPVGRRVIKITNRLTHLMTLRQPWLKFLRNHMVFPILNLNFVQRYLLKKIAGLS